MTTSRRLEITCLPAGRLTISVGLKHIENTERSVAFFICLRADLKEIVDYFSQTTYE